MFSIFVQRRGANAVQFTASQRRLDHIASTNRTFSSARTNYRVHFIDKDDDIVVLAQFFKNTLDALLKLTTEHGAGNHTANIQRNDTLTAQRRRNIALVNTTGQTLDDCRLTNAWLTDQHRIVLLTASKDRNHTAQFTLSPGSRVQLALSSFGSEITPILI